MKIMMLNTLYFPNIVGGAEKSVQLLAEGLADRGHEVVVVSVAPERKLEQIGPVKAYYLPHHNYYWGGMPRKVGSLKKLGWHLKDIVNLDLYPNS